MGSKSFSTVNNDSSAMTATDSATVLRAEEGSTVNLTSSLTDYGSIANALDFADSGAARAFDFGDRAFSFGGQALNLAGSSTGRALDFGGDALGLIGSLTKSSLQATQDVAKSTTSELANAYQDARGAISSSKTVTILVVVVIAAAMVAFAYRGK